MNQPVPQNAAGGVAFEGVSKRYGSFTAVDAVSFTIAPGELVTLLGPSGCGKTTTLRMVAGLETASGGTIRIGGVDVTRRAAHERDVSMVFQSYALFPHLNVLDNVCYGPIASGTKPAQARELAQDKLRMLGLAGLEQRLPSELSGGQQQRVAVARSLVLEPAVLLFDEPLSNLDAKLRRRVRQEIRELQQSLALTVLYVTHDQSEALAVSDRVIVMNGGRIAQQGTPAELYERPASRFLADFIGDANLVDGSLQRDGERSRFEAGGVVVPVEPTAVAAGLPAGPASLALRPHRIGLVAAGQGRFDATCRRADYLGSHAEVLLDSPWGELLAFGPVGAAALRRGDAVGVAFEPGDAVLLPRD
ncbi:ABC transporter ATP-binding protein [Sphaerotilus mobilis]|uniref:Iron(III) transport system ATP-binding protein n=1 Tax=Sphaerotilus mobilis TaxID=47994 RepID=A0A4Q7LJY9_9BURK|nr:ABC transporter ATP-binding protein [Sphaerotilus mobilis]RZS54704.1 iron(III) transport system ATP-binding protein [Sphaerotilus mobilis]